jgi:8-oxo-dGTP diphosphatase
VKAGKWLAASCHDPQELAQAARIGVDFAVLSPVAATPGHHRAAPLGWQRFAELVEQVNLPVFALGGMRPEHLAIAWQHGGQGIAAVRALWKGPLREDGSAQPGSR